MKKIVAGIFALLPLAGFAQGSFTIKAKVGHLDSPAKAYLNYLRADNTMGQDSAVLHNGVFTFKGIIDEPAQGRITLVHKGERLYSVKNPDNMSVLVSQGVIIITTKDSLIHASMSGSKLTNDYAAEEKKKTALNNRLVKLIADYEATPKEQRQPKVYGKTYEETFNDNLTQNVENDFAYITTHPGSYLSVLALQRQMTSAPLERVLPAFEALHPALKQTTGGKAVAKKLTSRQSIAVGGIAPDFTQPDTAGHPVSLHSFRGKYVLVDFWASWCKPCRAENPNVVKAYNEYKDKNFTILGVSLDSPEAKDKWLNAIKTDQLPWTQVSELTGWMNSVASTYSIHSIPQNVLVSPEGKVLAKNLRGEELHQKLAELIH